MSRNLVHRAWRYNQCKTAVPWKGFLSFWNQGGIWILLVLDVALFHSKTFHNPSRYVLKQFTTFLSWSPIPPHLSPFPQAWRFILYKPALEPKPEIFNSVHVRRLCVPNHHPQFLFPLPVLDLSAGVLVVFILLKIDIKRDELIIIQVCCCLSFTIRRERFLSILPSILVAKPRPY